MNYESRHETLASIPQKEARGWKRFLSASLSISAPVNPITLYRAVHLYPEHGLATVDNIIDNGIGTYWTRNRKVTADYGGVVFQAQVHPDHVMTHEEIYKVPCGLDEDDGCICSAAENLDDWDFNEEIIRDGAQIHLTGVSVDGVSRPLNQMVTVRNLDDNQHPWNKTGKHPFMNDGVFYRREVTAAQKLRPEDAAELERQMGEIAHKEGWQDTPTPYQDQSQIIHTFDNGWTIREPISNGDAYREGELMSNCMSDDGLLLEKIQEYNRSWGDEPTSPEKYHLQPDRQTWTTYYVHEPHPELRYLSLRDENNLPHATFNWQDGLLIAALGRHNSELKPEYKNMVLDFAHQQRSDFEEYKSFEDEEPTNFIAQHTNDRSCCGTSKVAALEEDQNKDQELAAQESEETLAQQQQMKALQQSHTFNHMVYIHKVDPNAAAELFFRSPVLLNQEHEREHAEGLIDNHLPETLIVANKTCRCGSTSFRRVIDPLRTYAKGGADAFYLECRECYTPRFASSDDWDWQSPNHDYEPEWDYEIDENPHPDAVAAVEAHRPLLESAARHAGLARPRIHFVKFDDDAVARYANGTKVYPVLMINATSHEGEDLHRQMGLSLLHELGHAIQDTNLGDVDDHHHDPELEDMAEDYAHDVFDVGHEEAHDVLMLGINDYRSSYGYAD